MIFSIIWAVTQSFENTNTINSIVEFIRAGEKHGNAHMLGVELEHIIMDENGHSVEYVGRNEKAGTCDILAELAPLYDELHKTSDCNNTKFVKVLKRADAEVSFEPGGQLEVALSPTQSVTAVQKAYNKFYSELKAVCDSHNYTIEYIGIRPDKCALEVPLMQTNRYACMDARFRTVGSHGPVMMRNSAALQVSIDYDNEEDCGKKLLVATCLSPLIYFLFDNSPVFERTQVGSHKITPSGLNVPSRMARYTIWKNTDADRCGAIECCFKNFSYKNYACQAMNVPIIYTHGEHKNLYDPKLNYALNYDSLCGPYTANELSHNRHLNNDEINHVLSMGFYDARLKQVIELRAADCVPPQYMFAYIAMIQGIFYNETSLNKAYELFANFSKGDYEQAGNLLYTNGWNAKVYGEKVQHILRKIVEIAQGGLNKNEEHFLNPVKNLIHKKQVVMDELIYNFDLEKTPFKPISKTSDYTTMQLENYKKLHGDINGRRSALAAQKQNKAIYAGKIVRQGYFSKIYSLTDRLVMANLVATTFKIFDKIINHYLEDERYAELFGFDDFTKRLINMRPQYSSNFPIGRFDIFYNDKTASFEFCEFNAAGSAAMNEVFHVCNAAESSASFKHAKHYAKSNNKSILQFELFESWAKQFVCIYNEWAHNTENTAAQPNGDTHFAIIDFLDNCAINDFYHFAETFNQLGYKTNVVDIHDLKFDGKNMTDAKGNRIDAFYKRVTLDDLYARQAEPGVEDLIAAVEAEVVCPIDWFTTQIIHSKQICYVLHHPETKNILSKSEWNFIQMHQPETYKLDMDIASSNWAIKNKDEYLCKPISSRGAKNIYPGKLYNTEQWTKILQECAESENYILQRYANQVESPNVCIDPYDDERTLNPNWRDTILPYSNMEGLYCYNGHFAGVYLRQGRGLINSRNLDNIDCATFYEE